MQRYLGSLFLVAVYGEALECTSWSSEPSWPTYHIINPVSRNADGVLSVQPLNDANAIYMYKGIYHAMCQEGGGNFTHAVSNDLVHWYHLKNALSPEPNTTWNYKGACDGTVSFPKGGPGEGPVVLFGADCAIPLEKGLGDAPRVGQARPADVTDPYMVEWVFGPRNASFEGFPCSFPGKVWRSEVGPYWNMVCALNGVTPWARYTSTDPDLLHWTLADPSFTKPHGVNKDAQAGDLWNPIPNAPPQGPTHMINFNTGQGFYLGTYDAQLEVFNITSGPQWIDVGSGGTPFGPSAHWAAVSNDFSVEPRVLWVAWVLQPPSALSLVRELFYDRVSGSLASFPVVEYETLRNKTFAENEDWGMLSPGSLKTFPTLPPEAGGALDLLVSFVPPLSTPASRFGVAVRAPTTGPQGAAGFVEFSIGAPDARTGVRVVNVTGNMAYLEPINGKPVCWDGGNLCPSNSTLLFPGETLDVRILVDRPIIETFVLGGRFAWAVAADWVPKGPFRRYNPANSSIHFYNYDGESSVGIKNVSVYGMGCGWAATLPTPKSTNT